MGGIRTEGKCLAGSGGASFGIGELIIHHKNIGFPHLPEKSGIDASLYPLSAAFHFGHNGIAVIKKDISGKNKGNLPLRGGCHGIDVLCVHQLRIRQDICILPGLCRFFLRSHSRFPVKKGDHLPFHRNGCQSHPFTAEKGPAHKERRTAERDCDDQRQEKNTDSACPFLSFPFRQASSSLSFYWLLPDPIIRAIVHSVKSIRLKVCMGNNKATVQMAL